MNRKTDLIDGSACACGAEALRQSRERFCLLFHQAAVGIKRLDWAGHLLEVNNKLCEILGYSREELLQLSLPDFTYPEDMPHERAQLSRLLSREISSYSVEKRCLRKEGSLIWVRVTSSLPSGSDRPAQWWISVVEDITERKQAEEALQRAHDELEQKVKDRTATLTQTIGELQAEAARHSQAELVLHERSVQLRLLASELTMTEHRERQRLAQVLHDGLQQILVAAKFRLALMGRAADTDRQQATSEVSGLIDDAIETSRALTAELSPPILREFGLIPALEWLARWMQDRHGLRVDLTAHGRVQAAEDIIVLLFHATRELLLNVAKHAGIKSAQVKVTRTKGQIKVEVTDSGAGFNTKQLRIEGGRGGGFGLFSVHERLTLLGGKMTIDSTPGRGSRITMIVGPQSMIEDSGVGPAERHQEVSVAPEPPFKEKAAPEKKIRVLVVDDHIVMRQGLARRCKKRPM